MTVLADSGAARYYRDHEDHVHFVLFVPLLCELTHDGLESIVKDLTCTTKPFARGTAELVGHTLYIREITHLERFNDAVCSAFTYLAGYKCPVLTGPSRNASSVTFPMVESGDWDSGSIDGQLCETSLMGIGYAAYQVRQKARLLTTVERKALGNKVMPEYVSLLREAERLAHRIVLLESLQSDVVDSAYDEWLTSRGFALGAQLKPIREACINIIARKRATSTRSAASSYMLALFSGNKIFKAFSPRYVNHKF